MYARTFSYGIITLGAMLLAGCSHDDMTSEVTPVEPVTISFNCATENDDNTTRAVIGQKGAMNSEDLYYTGFGVFASLSAEKRPDLMYNQEVAFTFVGDMDDPMKGYWSYYPIKYWPASMTNFCISAYAPYQELPISPDADDTGIIGISVNTESPYIDYRRSEKPDSCVDLLWYYGEPSAIPAASENYAAGTLGMKMHHALARLEINVKLASAPAAGTKVLIDSIALTGQMAKTGRLSLTSQTTEGEGLSKKYYPVWSNLVFDKDGGGYDINHTFTIDNTDNNDQSYGIIDSPVRYINGLPYAWQPEGLTTEPQNALSTGDRKTYVYLIPQPALTLTVLVRYHKMTTSTDDMGVKTTTAVLTNVATPLRGNTTYSLNLILSGI